MADLVLQGPQLPFVLGGAGSLTLRAGSRAIGQPLPPGVETVLGVELNAAGKQKVTIGAPGSWTVGLTAGGAATLTAIWRTSAALARQYGLEAYFHDHPDDVVLVFTVGANAEGALRRQDALRRADRVGHARSRIGPQLRVRARVRRRPRR